MEKIPSLYVNVRKNQVNKECFWVLCKQGIATKWMGDFIKCVFRNENGDYFLERKIEVSPENHELIMENPKLAKELLLDAIADRQYVMNKYDQSGKTIRYWLEITSEDDEYETFNASLVNGVIKRGEIGYWRYSELANQGKVGPMKDFEISIPYIAPDTILQSLQKHVLQSIVWHHPDGRMASVKLSDYGY